MARRSAPRRSCFIDGPKSGKNAPESIKVHAGINEDMVTTLIALVYTSTAWLFLGAHVRFSSGSLRQKSRHFFGTYLLL